MASESPNLEDNICPICLYIFIQPVTMPCDHELCLECFKQNVEEANFCCPMCRIRISTWARRAARNKSLVNEKRWNFIQEHFPYQVQSRLEGKEEEDEEMQALNVSIKLSEPGEIRTEYEQQLKQLQDQRREERRKELEASESLILKLQEEEEKNRKELDRIAQQDEELARKMSQTDVTSPLGIEQRLRASRSSSSDASTCDRSESNCESMECFINKMRTENNMSKSPYPYRCLTPIGTGKICTDKDKLLVMEEKFKRQKVKRDKNLITTQDIANLEEQFKLHRNRPVSNTETIEIDQLRRGTESNMSMGMTHVVSNSNLNQDEILDQMSSGLDVSVNIMDTNPSTDDIIVIADTPDLETTEETVSVSSRKSSSSTSTCSFKSAHGEMPERSSSAQSSDSISQELAHFRPIQSCPLTPPRKLPSGKVVEPQLIRTTPRNLNKSGLGSPLETNLSDIDARSPIMQRRLSELAEERKDKVMLLSKYTSTGKGEENRNPHASENPSSLVTRRNLSSSRSVEFKDISNSPINTKRKLDTDIDDESTIQKKPILPLVPDLDDDIYINDTVIKVTRNAPAVNSKDRLSRSKKGKSAKVRYTSGESNEGQNSPQLSIMKWMKRNDEIKHCMRNDKPGYFIDSSRDEVDGETKGGRTNRKKFAKHEVVVQSKHGKDNEVSPQKEEFSTRNRPRRHRISAYKDDIYVYGNSKQSDKQSVSKAVDTSSNETNSDVDSEISDDSIVRGPERKKRKTDTFGQKSSAKPPVKQPKSKPKPVLKSTKQSKRSSQRTITSKEKLNPKQNKTMHDFFSLNNVNAVKGKPEEKSDDACDDGMNQEEIDRKMAEELQKQFELEARLHLSSMRFKGSSDEYSFRTNRKPKHLSV